MALWGCLTVASAVGVAACGGSGASSVSGGGGKSLTVYSSLPLHGPSRAGSEAINNGAKLALKAVGGKVNGFTVDFKTLDDSARTGNWDADKTKAAAGTAADDENTIAYLGERDSGATAVSLPILNRAKIPQVSPSSTGVGLTTSEPGAAAGEPAKYYPTRKRTFARIVPRDSVQGAAVATVMNEDACRKVYIIHDMEVYGQGLSKVVKKDAAAAGLRVVANKGYDPKASGYRSLARKVKATFADCVFVSISAGSNGVQLFKDLAAVTFAQLYGPDRVAQPTFTDPKRGGVPKSIANRIKVTSPPLSEYSYPTRAQSFFADYQKAYHKKAQPYAIYGYEAMALILDAMKRAGGKANNKIAVNEQIHSTKRRKSVLGRYSIDRNGDATLTDYGLYTVDKGDLLFLKVIKAKVR